MELVKESIPDYGFILDPKKEEGVSNFFLIKWLTSKCQ